MKLAADGRELVQNWYTGIRIAILSHYECAKLYETYSKRLGYPLVTLSTVVGTSLINNSISKPDAPPAMYYIAAVLGGAVAILTSIQTFSKFSETATRHLATATDLSRLRRELEETMVLLPPGPVPKELLQSIRTRWDELSKNAPSIPKRVYDRHLVKARQDAGEKSA